MNEPTAPQRPEAWPSDVTAQPLGALSAGTPLSPAYPSYAHGGGAYRPYPVMVPCAPRALPPPTERAWKAREVLAFLGVILVADLFLWNSCGGVSFALFLLAAAALGFAMARVRRAPLRLASLGVLLASVAARAALLPTAGTVVLGLALLFAFVVQLRTRSGSAMEALSSFVHTFVAYPSRVWALVRGTTQLVRRVPLQRGTMLQVFVPLALVGVFGGVFALANPLVGRYVSQAATWVATHIAVPEFLRVLFWIALAPLGLALIRPAIRFARSSVAIDRSTTAAQLSVRIANNSLVGLNVAFAAFLALDANYLWRGAPPPGMTTQTYAHEGAFWLTVALFLTTVVLGIAFRGPLAFDAKAKTTRTLAWVWIGQNLALAGSAFRRMAIHVEYSGLSNLRIFGYFGASLVLVGLVLVAMKLRGVRSARWLMARQLDAFAIAFVLFSVLPTHRLAASVNVARLQAGELRPAIHLVAQAHEDESADVLLPLLHHPDARIREGVAQLLLDRDDEGKAHKGAWYESRLPSHASRKVAARHAELLAVRGNKDGSDVRQALHRLVVAANDGQSWELLLSLPAAQTRGNGSRID